VNNMKAIVVLLVCASAVLSAKIQPKFVREHPVFSNRQGQLKIVGGEEAQPNSIPYQVGLFLDGSFCGGTLIDERHVLTAAHCGEITNRPQVVLGAHEVESDTEDHITISGSKVTVHPDWDSNTLENDVSVIQLSQAAPLSAKIQPVKLAPSNAGDYAGETAQASGWGKTKDSDTWISPVLRKVSNPIVSNKECEDAFDGQLPIQDSLICFSGSGGRSICSGDSGGPLVVEENGETYQVGVTSWVISLGCAAGYPSGFSRVSSFRNWIDQQTKSA